MASFLLYASPASFMDAGEGVRLIRVTASNAGALGASRVEASKVSALETAMADFARVIIAKAPGASFIIGNRLEDGRAPAGYRDKARGSVFKLEVDAEAGEISGPRFGPDTLAALRQWYGAQRAAGAQA